MEKVVSWFNYYKDEITWFLIGFLTFAGLDELSEGKYMIGFIDLALAYLNYKCYSKF